MRQLCNFIIADLKSHHSQAPAPAYPTAGLATALEDASASQDINFPKSLYLIHPLFSTYELNPVAPNAQASVPVPDGLDLDAWIVPPPREPTAEEGATTEKKKSKKGKEKEVNGKKPKTSSKKRSRELELLQDGDLLTPVSAEVETAEERERVSESLQR